MNSFFNILKMALITVANKGHSIKYVQPQRFEYSAVLLKPSQNKKGKKNSI